MLQNRELEQTRRLRTAYRLKTGGLVNEETAFPLLGAAGDEDTDHHTHEALVGLMIAVVCLLAVIGIGIWYVVEALCRHFISSWQRGGWRLGKIDRYLPVFSIMAVIPLAAACAGLVAACLWSIAGSWFFPSALPQNFHLIHWQDMASYVPLLKNSFLK